MNCGFDSPLTLPHAPPCWRWFAALLAVLALAPAPAPANDPPAAEPEKAAGDASDEAQPADDASQAPPAGLVVVRLPLAAGDDSLLRSQVLRTRDRLLTEARERGDARRPILVLHLAPQGNVAGKTPFETALSLARLLSSRELADVKTVAWLPETVRGHGVLIALACEELLVGATAEFGEAAVDEEDPQAVSDVVISAYREMARSRGVVPEAVAAAMIDARADVIQVESEEGTRFLTADEFADYRANHEVLSDQRIAAAGALARFTGAEGRRFGFVKYQAADRAAAARALGVPAEALAERDALGEQWQPAVIDVSGEIDTRHARQIETLIGQHLEGGGNWIALRIDSVGGDLTACLQLAQTVAELDRRSVRTVAYVPVEAKGGAALVALACNELVMHDDAQLGVGPEAREAPQPPPQRGPLIPAPGGQPQPPQPAGVDDRAQLDAVISDVRNSLAPRAQRSWSLMAAMLDSSVELFQYSHKATGERRLMSAEAAAAMPDADQWTRGAAVQTDNQPLNLTGARATELGVAAHTVDGFDQLKRIYGVEVEPRVLAPNWALELIEALASPGFSILLLMIGLAALFVEIKTAGLGIGGVVATICFVLFFWAKYLDQTAGVLEIVLFLTGVLLVLVEVFVIPGFGIFGLAGALLVIFSLVLASQTFVLPQSVAQLRELRRSITTVAGAFFGMLVLAIAVRRYLPNAPILNRMVLAPPPPEEQIIRSSRETLADYRRLVGATGQATTNLWPSGKATFDGELVDVVAQGEPIDRGADIVVVSAVGNRVVVRAVS
ncbi:MAG: hypothetical protein CMJ58_23340 [Planctomycetaceae bacterium]|nr:hypothetical protein [Planctomycetaceae bacterium]